MSLDSDNITVERLAGTCGAIVRGIDLSTPQSPADIERLKTLLDEHLVIALPEQDIDLDRQEQLTDELNFANNWHTDLSYLPAPPAYTILHARQVPDAGGDTMWANQYMAYETLPDKVKEQINGLRTTHSAGLAYGTGGYLEAVAGKSSMGIEPSKDAYETRSHPLVIRHPRTGRPALFVNSSYTTEIDGMDADQGRELLGRLMMHATNPNFTCRLRWEPNMLTIWDNATTQHLAVNDYPGNRREMFRTSVIGTEPQPA